MLRPRRSPLWWLVIVLLAACKGEAPSAEPSAAVKDVTSAPSADPSAAAKNVSSASPSASAAAPAETSRGRVACGAESCDAKTQLCCVGWRESQPELRRCVAKPTAPPDAGQWDAVTASWEACSRDEYRACDGPSDCAAGETCCEEQSWMPDDNIARYNACVPLQQGKVACHHDEVCNEADPGCVRPGATCTAGRGRSTCAVPRRHRPACGGAPCEDGSACVEAKGKRACKPTSALKDDDVEIACEVGADCAADETCFRLDEGSTRCDRGPETTNGFDRALCKVASDCSSFCRGANDVTSCRGATAKEVGHCECHARCEKDTDCARSENCYYLSMQRAGSTAPDEPYCDRATKACDCREPRR